VKDHRIGNYPGAARRRPAPDNLPPPRGYYCAGVYTLLPKALQPQPPREEPKVNDATENELASLLAELENVLAQAEEIRYRIAANLGSTPRPSQPRPGPDTSAQRPNVGATRPGPDTSAQRPNVGATLDTTSLCPTGPGLWAWAKELGQTNAIAELGQAAGFPRRIVDWSPDQVEQAVDALAQLLAGGGQPTPHARPLRAPRGTKPWTRQHNDI